MKTAAEKKVNKEIKKFNRELERDVFDGRFEVRQYQKARVDGMSYFLYQLIDNKEPDRNYIIPGWLNEFDFKRRIWEEMNNFIVLSDFWSIYHNKPDTYDKENDKYVGREA